MKTVNCIAAVIGFVLAMAPWSMGTQTPADQLAASSSGTTIEASAAIPADQQPTKEQLTRLFDLIRVRDQIESITKMLPALMQQQMTDRMKRMQQDHPAMAPLSEAQQQVFTNVMTKVMNKFMTRLMELYRFDEMIEDMAGLYQKYLTRPDVEGIINFYSSPAGQHLLDVQPAILKEYMPLVMQRMQDRVKPLTDEMLKEMKEELTKAAAGSNNAASQSLPRSASSGIPAATPVEPVNRVYMPFPGDGKLNAQGNGVINPGVVNPRMIVSPAPAYTEEARKAGIEGVVALEAVVRKNGTIDRFRILKGLGYGLDESAIATIAKQWLFEPGTLNGKPVDVRINVEVYFRLYSKRPDSN